LTVVRSTDGSTVLVGCTPTAGSPEEVGPP